MSIGNAVVLLLRKVGLVFDLCALPMLPFVSSLRGTFSTPQIGKHALFEIATLMQMVRQEIGDVLLRFGLDFTITFSGSMRLLSGLWVAPPRSVSGWTTG